VKTSILLATCLALVFLTGSASAVTLPLYIQDDFQLTFGEPGNPGASGGELWSAGRLLTPENIWAADYRLTGINQLAAYQVGDEYWTDYVTNLDIGVSSPQHGWQATYWSGTGSITTRVKVGGGLEPSGQYAYSATDYWHPVNPTGSNPSEYQSIGSGAFTGAGQEGWGDVAGFSVPWFGTYNWSYNEELTWQRGNMQGAMVPEPGSMILLVAGGLVALAIGRRRRKN